MAEISVERMGDADVAAVRSMLVDLTLDEQQRYDHPRQTRAEIERGLPELRTGFSGENHLLVAREAGPDPLGVCWCVLFDPGTGLEGEVAELWVTPEARGRGAAAALLDEAMRLFRRRHVSFVCAWTRDDNPAAMAAYRAAGFAPTEQTVLTWLPLEGSATPQRRGGGGGPADG